MALGALLLALVGVSTGAQASETAKLTASFGNPYRLGVNTAFTFTFKIGSSDGQIPSPLTGVDLRLPAGLGLFSSTLGEEICEPAVLLTRGLGACSRDAILGSGTGLAKVFVGPEILELPINVTILAGPANNRHTGVLYYAEGGSAVIAELLFPGLVLGESAPFSTLLKTTIPTTTGLPDTPDAAVTEMRVTLGPDGLRYSKQVHGRTVIYHPAGMAVPENCPTRGFPFSATFQFEDGTSVTSNVSLACPPRARHAKGAGRRK